VSEEWEGISEDKIKVVQIAPLPDERTITAHISTVINVLPGSKTLRWREIGDDDRLAVMTDLACELCQIACLALPENQSPIDTVINLKRGL